MSTPKFNIGGIAATAIGISGFLIGLMGGVFNERIVTSEKIAETRIQATLARDNAEDARLEVAKVNEKLDEVKRDNELRFMVIDKKINELLVAIGINPFRIEQEVKTNIKDKELASSTSATVVNN